MILVYPHNADWDDIAKSPVIRPGRHRTCASYFERLEDCRHRPLIDGFKALPASTPPAMDSAAG